MAEGRRRRLTPVESEDLKWFFREALAAVSGLGAQAYEPSFDHQPGGDEGLLRAFGRVNLARRFRRIEATLAALLELEGGALHWRVLRWVFGPPRRDDPWADFVREPELAPIIRHTPSLRAVVAKRQDAPPEDVGRAAVKAWERAYRGVGGPADASLAAAARIEAREMYERAGEAYRVATEKADVEWFKAKPPPPPERGMNPLGPLAAAVLRPVIPLDHVYQREHQRAVNEVACVVGEALSIPTGYLDSAAE